MSGCGFCGSHTRYCQCDWCEECGHLTKYCRCEPEGAELALDEDVDGFQDWDISLEADTKVPMAAPRANSGAEGK